MPWTVRREIEMDIFERRLAAVRAELKAHNVSGLLLTNLEEGHGGNIRYLTNFSGTNSLCLVTRERAIFITDSRYALQAKKELADSWEVHIASGRLDSFNIVRNAVVGSIGVIGEQISADMLYRLRKVLRPSRVVRLPDILMQIQEIKDEREIFDLRRAVDGIGGALKILYEFIGEFSVSRNGGAVPRMGLSEIEIERELSTHLPLGASFAFDSIIASGARSAFPHGVASDKILEAGDIVQFDVGCKAIGYHSDISRVAVLGRADNRQRKMHKAVQTAVRVATDLYLPGKPVFIAAEAANKVLASYGFPPVPHGLGHGIGTRIHELPFVSVNSVPSVVFREGQVVTVEPGIYEEGYGGMRIERDVLITSNGPEYLDSLSDDLIEIPA